jgi:spoIIIJ-associated protein
MSKRIEFQGKNVKRALERAGKELSLEPEKIKYEVLSHGSSGIFGLVGVKKAKIKVILPSKIEKPEKKSRTKPITQAIPSAGEARDDQDTHEGFDEETGDGEIEDEALVSFGIQALQQIVDGISAGATIESTQKRGNLYFSVSGGDSGVLIGKRGQTLEAIQYLLEKMINKKSDKRLRVIVDVEGYLEKRKNNLRQMASRMAEKAKKIHKPVTIGQMNAHDRRIVHIHLKDESGVRTQSIGDGYYRKLMIFPKKQGGSRRRNSNSKV